MGEYLMKFNKPAKRSQLQKFYTDNSILTLYAGNQPLWRDRMVVGKENILKRLAHPAIRGSFQPNSNVCQTLDGVKDGRPCVKGAVLYLRSGRVDNPKFSQIFVLRPTGDSFMISNHI